MDLKSSSLSQLVFHIKQQLNTTFDTPIWITAEISELNTNYSGHCYLELIEKNEDTDSLVAKSRATIWAGVFRILKPYFETSTRETLKSGLKVLIKVTVEFHEFYGFSLNIHDIDPSYTVGDLVLKRNIIIDKLRNEGVFDMNKGIEIPLVPQRIAVITSETAAGYGDFIDQLTNNQFSFNFHVKLFPATMQGASAPQSMIDAFNQIFDEIDNFDCVVLIRGGGSKIDLSCFDDFDLSYVITQLPLPVIAGIGHDRDESVADLVANLSLKTPTAVAEFLIDMMAEYWNRMNNTYDNITSLTGQYLNEQSSVLKESSSKLFYLIQNRFDGEQYKLSHYNTLALSKPKQALVNNKMALTNYANSLSAISKGKLMQGLALGDMRERRLAKWLNNYLNAKKLKLANLENKTNLVDPIHVLKRGYSIISKNGSAILSKNELNVGDNISIEISDGNILTEVKEVTK